jgi:hypothetical protein
MSESRSDKFLAGAKAAAEKRGIKVAPIIDAVKREAKKGGFDDLLRAAAEKRGIAYAPPAPLAKSGKTVYMTGDTMAAQRQPDPAAVRFAQREYFDKKSQQRASATRARDEFIAEQEKKYSPVMSINRPPLLKRIRDLFRGTVGAKVGV